MQIQINEKGGYFDFKDKKSVSAIISLFGTVAVELQHKKKDIGSNHYGRRGGEVVFN